MNVFEEAISVLRERGWHQGWYEHDTGGVCLLGALGIATNDVPWGWKMEDRRALRRAVYAAGFADNVRINIAHWNDAPERTLEDVLLVLKHAKAEA